MAGNTRIQLGTVDIGAYESPVQATAVTTWQSGALVSAADVMTGRTIVAGGEDLMIVSSGGVANSTTVSSGGVLLISSGGKATGTLTLAAEAVVSAYEGSIIDFDISTVTIGNAALINDLSLIQGAPNFTVTVSVTQTVGTYSLAGGAAGFDKTITVITDTGSELGTVTVGNQLKLDNVAYALTIDGGVLAFTVTNTISGDVTGSQTVSSGYVA